MMMNMERRHGEMKPVIQKALVKLDGAPFKHSLLSVTVGLWKQTTFIQAYPVLRSDRSLRPATKTLQLEQAK